MRSVSGFCEVTDVAKKGSFIDRIDRARDQGREEGFMTGQHFTRQLCMDLTAVVLNREFGFGADRLQRYNAAMVEMYGEYAECWNKDTVDLEYAKANIDGALRQIFGDRFEDWDKRYN